MVMEKVLVMWMELWSCGEEAVSVGMLEKLIYCSLSRDAGLWVVHTPARLCVVAS